MSDIVNEMQHELACRSQIIKDLQRELEQAKQMTNSANLSALRMRDEIIMVNAQTHGIVKVVMRRLQVKSLLIPGEELKEVLTTVLEKGARENLGRGDLSFTMRAMTAEEEEKEETYRRQAEAAIKRVEENSPAKD